MTHLISRTKNLVYHAKKLGFLKKDEIKIKHPEHVEKIVASFIEAGCSKLQFVVDFDDTLTRYHCGGKPCSNSFGVLEDTPLLPSFYKEETSKNFEKFYCIEIDDTKTAEEKIPFMREWHSRTEALLSKCCFSKETLKEIVLGSNVQLRDRTELLFEKLKKNDVPTLIFSAGMGDILEHVLWHFNIYSDKVKVISNFFKYDDKDIMTGYNGELIHMYNKNETALQSSDYFLKRLDRTNILLMGDSLGDTDMASGMPKPNTILKIGFLNHNAKERLDAFMNAYDIVLIDDQTMDVAFSIHDMLN